MVGQNLFGIEFELELSQHPRENHLIFRLAGCYPMQLRAPAEKATK
jgi:hypothetical protein